MVFESEVFMITHSLRRWSHPKAILVVSDLAESPAHTLRVISGIRTTGAKVFLVQLPYPAYATWRLGSDPHFVTPSAASVEYRSAKATDQAFLWAEILSEVTVLRNTPIERIPALTDSLGVDMIALTRAEIGRMPFHAGDSHEVDLFGSLKVPIMICGVRTGMSLWSARDAHKILVPVAFGPHLELQMRFACRYARRHHGRVTVLHVFENGGMGSEPWERTPVAVEAKLPIAEMKQEGIMCPLEIAIFEGYPERKILAFNQQKPHDLIIMTGPCRRDSIQALGHSVVEDVIAESSCPVLILGWAMLRSFAGLDESSSQISVASKEQNQSPQVGD